MSTKKVTMEVDQGDAGFELPTPKRRRTEDGQQADIERQNSKPSSNISTPFDDMDDLYCTSMSGDPSPTKDMQDPKIPFEVPQQAAQHPKPDPPRFQLPGLGLESDEGRSKNAHEGVQSVSVIGGDEELGTLPGAEHNKLAQERGSLSHHPNIGAGAISTDLGVGMESSHTNDDGGELKAAPELHPHDGELSTGRTAKKDLPSNNTPETEGEPSTTTKALKEEVVPSPNTAPETETNVSSAASADLFMAEIVPQMPTQIPDTNPNSAEGGVGTHLATSTATVSIAQDPVRQNREVNGRESNAPHDHTSDNVQQTDVANPVLSLNKNILESHKMDADAEVEIDSSPIASSSSSSSDSSSSDDSDDYEMLDPEEQVRRLMQEDGGSDDDGPRDIGSSKAPLRTLNEKPDEIVPKPNIIITEEMSIQELGNVENLVENLVVIKAKTSGEYQVLETGSVLCLGDKSVIGVVGETLGRVEQPYYSVRFTNAASISEAGISKGTMVFYSEKHSTTVFTQPLKAFKGSDASNLHDEEVADDELEFSDDEAEAEYKRKQKHEKQARRDGRSDARDGHSKGPGGRGSTRGRGRGRGDRRGGKPSDHFKDSVPGGVKYDDMDTDEPYTPLARPSNLHEMMTINEAPSNNHDPPFNANRSDRDQGFRDHGRGNGYRGRGDRGRGHRGGRGDRGGRGGHEETGYNTYPQNQLSYPHTQTSPSQMQQPPFYSSQNQHQPADHYSYTQQYAGYPAMQSPSSHYGDNYQTPSNYQSYYQNQNPNSQGPIPNIPPGAFINPAFFAQPYQNQISQQNPFMPPPNRHDGASSSTHHNQSNGSVSPGSNNAFLAAQERLKLLQNLSNK
ncbi:hypothetical protein G7Y79_00026g059180 [Physcia stellaris]|nr:hypothetical protein G7Y79_00026g059180 [Physcia stellaris]